MKDKFDSRNTGAIHNCACCGQMTHISKVYDVIRDGVLYLFCGSDCGYLFFTDGDDYVPGNP